jgi:hypothetical protein
MSEEPEEPPVDAHANKAVTFGLKMPLADLYSPALKEGGKFLGEEAKIQLDKLRALRGDDNLQENMRRVRVAYHEVEDPPQDEFSYSQLSFFHDWTEAAQEADPDSMMAEVLRELALAQLRSKDDLTEVLAVLKTMNKDELEFFAYRFPHPGQKEIEPPQHGMKLFPYSFEMMWCEMLQEKKLVHRASFTAMATDLVLRRSRAVFVSLAFTLIVMFCVLWLAGDHLKSDYSANQRTLDAGLVVAITAIMGFMLLFLFTFLAKTRIFVCTLLGSRLAEVIYLSERRSEIREKSREKK